jgi:hypothetical protein
LQKRRTGFQPVLAGDLPRKGAKNAKEGNMMSETCAICGCDLHRDGEYAKPTVKGRSHATRHHFVAERFFGRSANRRGTQRLPIFEKCPWGVEKQSAVFCYECHEELIHNPVFLPQDVEKFAALVKARGFGEQQKLNSREKIAGRIQLFREVIQAGIDKLSG